MPILKAPPAHPKNETLQLRVSQDLKFRLMRYAEFIHANASYVATAALERLFRNLFPSWLSPESAHSDANSAGTTALLALGLFFVLPLVYLNVRAVGEGPTPARRTHHRPRNERDDDDDDFTS